MKRSAAWLASIALLIGVSCKDEIDLGGTNQEDFEGEGGEGAADDSGGASVTGGVSGTSSGGTGAARGGRGGSTTNGGDAGAGMGGNAGASGSNPSGGAGTAGAGAAGSPGGAGMGGAGAGGVSGSGVCDVNTAGADGCRPCPPTFDVTQEVETCVLGSDQMLVTTSFDANVTVVSVDPAAAPNACSRTGGFVSGGTSTHVVLEAPDQRRFTLVVRIPNLPQDFARPSDTFELKVSATDGTAFRFPRQTIRLSRGTNLELFAGVGSYWTTSGPIFPELESSGVIVADQGIFCQGPGVVCQRVHKFIGVSIGASSRTFGPFQTQVVGEYSVTVGNVFHYMEGFCDASPVVHVAGFATGSAVPLDVLDNLPECPLHGDVSVFPPIPPLACTPDQIAGTTFPYKGCYYNGDGCLCVELGGINTCPCVHPDSTCASGINTSPLGTCKLGEVPTGSTLLSMVCHCNENGFFCGG